jgi:NAD(P)-dependent dehydrogenase (short-subunit alcohol dehydrogenase family)
MAEVATLWDRGRHHLFSEGATALTVTPKGVVCITGTSSGFGLLLSVRLAKEGFQVIATMRDMTRKGRLVEMARNEGVIDRMDIVELDVTDFDKVDNVIQDIINRYQTLDVLVNNAGYAVGGFIEELPLEEWKRQFETNFFGVVAVTKAALPVMRQNRSGTIVNVSSISGRIAFPGLGPYVSSKFALEGFSESLRLEMLPHGVRVVLIEPGSYQTDIWTKGLESVKPNEASPYVHDMKVMVKGVKHISRTASDPLEVIRLISYVLRQKHPRLRYPIGRSVRSTLALKTALPWRWIERVIMKRFMRAPRN